MISKAIASDQTNKLLNNKYYEFCFLFGRTKLWVMILERLNLSDRIYAV